MFIEFHKFSPRKRIPILIFWFSWIRFFVKCSLLAPFYHPNLQLVLNTSFLLPKVLLVSKEKFVTSSNQSNDLFFYPKGYLAYERYIFEIIVAIISVWVWSTNDEQLLFRLVSVICMRCNLSKKWAQIIQWDNYDYYDVF